MSAKAAALPNGLFCMGERLCVAVFFAVDFTPPFEGLIVRSR